MSGGDRLGGRCRFDFVGTMGVGKMDTCFASSWVANQFDWTTFDAIACVKLDRGVEMIP